MNMKRILFSLTAVLVAMTVSAGDFNNIPRAWKWLDNGRVAFTYDGSFTDENAFSVTAGTHRTETGIKAPAKYVTFPIHPEGAVNLTWSPDSTMLAFTRNNDLYVADVATGDEKRLTFDGSELILNGYASWVYYEEILGRPSQYCAFWWSPDSQKLGYYRFDNTNVPMFPIYSPFGQDGTLRQTRYPKCGEPNPEVKIGMINVKDADPVTVWADFDCREDQYFGTPFWGADSRYFYISREPRTQNTLDLYRVDCNDGSKSLIYHEKVDTWLDWIEDMIFTDDGLYMVRDFDRAQGWQQIYFLSYDGKILRKLTDGPNWRVRLLREDKGTVYFTANRESTVRTALYKVDPKGVITALTDPDYSVASVSFSPDCKHFVARLSNFSTPSQVWLYETAFANQAWNIRKTIAASNSSKPAKKYGQKPASSAYKVADEKGADYNEANYLIPQNITMTTSDGLVLPAYIIYPKNFDPSRKYPVHVDIYGGPDTPQVRESWLHPRSGAFWYPMNGIIEVTADCRAAGHNGRLGLDQIYRQLSEVEVKDFVEWAEYLKSLPYVAGERIGVEGFSFGGTMTSRLVMEHSDAFHYGIAGGGVYDWSLYDTHYTERFMDTPQNNPEGYAKTRTVSKTDAYPVVYGKPTDGVEPVMLKITHGTGDDNVHFQNTLQLIDALHKGGKKFEFMVYPDGMHGYGGYQGMHFRSANQEFWLKYLRP